MTLPKSEWKLGNSKGGLYDLPPNYAGMGDEWALRFNQGRDYGSPWTHEQNFPTVSQGCAFWLGWRHVVLERGFPVTLPQEGDYLTDSQDIAAALESCALRPRQWPYWTGFNGPEDITALWVVQIEGEIVEMWATHSGTYWDACTTYEPLPVRWA